MVRCKVEILFVVSLVQGVTAYRLLLLLLIQVALAFNQSVWYITLMLLAITVTYLRSMRGQNNLAMVFPHAMPSYLNWVYCIALGDPPDREGGRG